MADECGGDGDAADDHEHEHDGTSNNDHRAADDDHDGASNNDHGASNNDHYRTSDDNDDRASDHHNHRTANDDDHGTAHHNNDGASNNDHDNRATNHNHHSAAVKPVLSIVMPCFRRADELQVSLLTNGRWLHKGIEIVISNDDPSDQKSLIQLASEHSARWQIVQNPHAHEWRNPSKAINVGIRHARADFVLIVSPETRFVSDVPKILLSAANTQPHHYHFGEVAFANEATVDTFRTLKRLSCGSLCASKDALYAVHGYDESLIGWGGDDYNLRARLRLSGVFGVCHESAMLLHPSMSGSHRVYSEDTQKRLREIVKPSTARWTEGDEWGRDFDHILYDSHPS